MKKISYVQEMIMKALVELMRDDNFKEITITQLTQEAQVARKTFYLNFKSKEDVLKLCIKQMSIEFKNTLPPEDELSIKILATSFFRFAQDHAASINLMIKSGVFTLLNDEFIYFIEQEIVSKRLLQLYTDEQMKIMPTEYSISYHSAGLCKLLEKWICAGMNESPEKMGLMYSHLVNDKNS